MPSEGLESFSSPSEVTKATLDTIGKQAESRLALIMALRAQALQLESVPVSPATLRFLWDARSSPRRYAEILSDHGIFLAQSGKLISAARVLKTAITLKRRLNPSPPLGVTIIPYLTVLLAISNPEKLVNLDSYLSELDACTAAIFRSRMFASRRLIKDAIRAAEEAVNLATPEGPSAVLYEALQGLANLLDLNGEPERARQTAISALKSAEDALIKAPYADRASIRRCVSESVAFLTSSYLTGNAGSEGDVLDLVERQKRDHYSNS